MTLQTHKTDANSSRSRTVERKPQMAVVPEEDYNLAPRTDHDQILNLQQTIGNQATLQLMGKPARMATNINIKMANGRKIQRLTAPSQQRKEQFKTLASSHNMTDEQIDALWQISSGGSGDPLLKHFEDADDYDMTMGDAKKHVADTNDAVYEAKVSIKNLAGLNATFGHAEADHHLKQIAETIRQSVRSKLEQAKAPKPISFRLKGKDIYLFIVVPANKKFSAVTIKKIIDDSKVEVHNYMKHQKDAKNNKIVNPKDKDQVGVYLSDVTVKPVSADADSSKDQSDDAPSMSAGRSEHFKNEAHTRKDNFIEKASEYNLSKDDAEKLFNLTASDRGEKLTGFSKAHDRKPTLERAIKYVQANYNFGVRGTYVEVDIRNLGGLTKAKDEATADKHFRAMSSLAEKTLMAQLPEADIAPFRHGGDEFSFIVVGAKCDQNTVEGAMAVAQAKVEAYEKEQKLEKIPHSKAGRKGGVGIVFGVAEIGRKGNQKPESIFSAADKVVETKKK